MDVRLYSLEKSFLVPDWSAAAPCGLVCEYDGHAIPSSTCPIPCPIRFHEHRHSIETDATKPSVVGSHGVRGNGWDLEVCGYFCSPECALASILGANPGMGCATGTDDWNRVMILKRMLIRVFGIPPRVIRGLRPAPPPPLAMDGDADAVSRYREGFTRLRVARPHNDAVRDAFVWLHREQK